MMQKKQIAVLGGSGFVGSAVIARLQTAGYQVTVLTRRAYRAKHLILLPDVKVIECDVHNEKALTNALIRADAVINLIGILHESRKQRFDTMHTQLPIMLGKLCKQLGIKRVIQMSSLGASQTAPSAYLRSKGAGENALWLLKQTLNITVFKPSIIFGRNDRFINLFASLIRYMPALLLVKPNAKFQPIWVEDVADCIALSIENIDTYGQTYELAGPEVYTFRALITVIMNTIKVKRPIIGLNDTLSYLQALMMEFLPVKLMSRDNLKSMELDSVSQAPFPAVFNFEPTGLEAIIPDYLMDKTPRGAYNRFRQVAAR
jgi:uncharacterized protein YbjT (DUF2867 family)